MPVHTRLTFAISSLVFFLLSAATLYRELRGPSDIWWTPYTMLVPLDEGRDRVEIYARGKPLGALLEAGQLSVAENGAIERARSARCGAALQQLGPCSGAASAAAAQLRGRLRHDRRPVPAVRDREHRLSRRAGTMRRIEKAAGR